MRRVLLILCFISTFSSTAFAVGATGTSGTTQKETLLYIRLAVDEPSRAVEQTLIEELRLASDRHTDVRAAAPTNRDAYSLLEAKERLLRLRQLGIERQADMVAAVEIYDGLPITMYLVVIEEYQVVGRVDELSPGERDPRLIALIMRELIDEVSLVSQDLGARHTGQQNTRQEWLKLSSQSKALAGPQASTTHKAPRDPQFSLVPLLRMNASVGQNHGIEEWLGGSMYGLRLVHPRLGIKLGATYLHSLGAFNNTEGISGWRLMGSLAIDYAFFHSQGARLSAIVETSAILSRMNAHVDGYDPVGVYRGNGKVSVGLGAQFKLSNRFGLYFGAAIGTLFTRRSFELTADDRQIYLNSYIESDLFLGGTFDVGTR